MEYHGDTKIVASISAAARSKCALVRFVVVGVVKEDVVTAIRGRVRHLNVVEIHALAVSVDSRVGPSNRYLRMPSRAESCYRLRAPIPMPVGRCVYFYRLVSNDVLNLLDVDKWGKFRIR